MVMIAASSTAHSQTTSKDSLCFSKDQAAKILKDLKRGEVCDSIAQNQGLQIINFKEIVGKDKQQINLMKEHEMKLQEELNTTRLRLKINKKITSFGIPGAIAAGIIAGIIIAK